MNVLYLPPEGPLLVSERDANALIAAAWGQDIDVIAVPVTRLSPDFFQLRTGLLGAVVQQLVNHRLRLAVVGDVSAHVAASGAFRDFVREGQVWFVADEAALQAKTTP